MFFFFHLLMWRPDDIIKYAPASHTHSWGSFLFKTLFASSPSLFLNGLTHVVFIKTALMLNLVPVSELAHLTASDLTSLLAREPAS